MFYVKTWGVFRKYFALHACLSHDSKERISYYDRLFGNYINFKLGCLFKQKLMKYLKVMKRSKYFFQWFPPI